jgi:hypothetical protein
VRPLALSILRIKINNCLRWRQKKKRSLMMPDVNCDGCPRWQRDSDHNGGPALGRVLGRSGSIALPKIGRATEPPSRRLGPYGLRSLPRLCRSVSTLATTHMRLLVVASLALIFARPRPHRGHQRSRSVLLAVSWPHGRTPPRLWRQPVTPSPTAPRTIFAGGRRCGRLSAA